MGERKEGEIWRRRKENVGNREMEVEGGEREGGGGSRDEVRFQFSGPSHWKIS